MEKSNQSPLDCFIDHASWTTAESSPANFFRHRETMNLFNAFTAPFHLSNLGVCFVNFLSIESEEFILKKIAVFFRHLHNAVLVAHTLKCRVSLLVSQGKNLYFPFRHKISDDSTVCRGQTFSMVFLADPRLIFTVEINRARCVVRTIQNNHRCCSHFRILRNWDEKTRI